MTLDEFLEHCEKKEGMDLDDEIVGRKFLTEWWMLKQDRS